MAGHLHFVQKILTSKKEFAQELNQDGLSPLHIASANGYVEIVKEFLKIDHNLCLVTGGERRIPLHYAAFKGRVGVMHKLLLSSPDSIIDTTARGETSLHLAVKNNQFQALRLLVDHVKDFGKEELLNYKDEQGNTILHLSVSRKQYEVLDLLLGQKYVFQATMEVNCVNKNVLTPLDILMLFQSEVGDREIEEILWHAGASTRAREVQPATLPVQTSLGQNNNINTTTTPRNEPSVQGLDKTRSQRLLEYFMHNERRESRSETRNTLLVIAILIITATYQAMFSPPGGVWQDDSASRKDNNGSHSTHVAGKSVMATKNKPLFVVFLLFNTIGYTFSVQLIYFLTNKFPLLWNLRISVFVLSVTYVASLNAISPSSILSIFLTAMSLSMPFLFVAKMLFGKVFGGIRYSFVSGPVMYV